MTDARQLIRAIKWIINVMHITMLQPGGSRLSVVFTTSAWISMASWVSSQIPCQITNYTHIDISRSLSRLQKQISNQGWFHRVSSAYLSELVIDHIYNRSYHLSKYERDIVITIGSNFPALEYIIFSYIIIHNING